jgi:putative transposase
LRRPRGTSLNVKGIARTPLAKSTHDAGWAQFVNILVSKAEEAGVGVVAVDPKNTTQACSRCGALAELKKKVSDRMHVCLCGYVQDWDINAAENILRLGWSLQARTYAVRQSLALAGGVVAQHPALYDNHGSASERGRSRLPG